MTWRKGFFRLWVVFTVLWVIGAGAFAYGPLQTYLETGRELTKLDKPTLSGPWEKYQKTSPASSNFTKAQAEAINKANAR